MANLSLENFSEEHKSLAPKECSLYLFECLDEETKKKVKEDWKKAGGRNTMPWWEWCLKNIQVSYN